MADNSQLAQIDYTARDFVGYRDALFQYAARVFPEWTSRSPADFGVVMTEMFAYLGDIMSFYQDRIADEAFMTTATLRSSVVAIAKSLGYEPYSALPAIGSVTFMTLDNQAADVTVPAGTKVISAFNTNLDRPVMFETDADIIVTGAGGSGTGTVTEGSTQGTRQLVLREGTGTDTSLTVDDLGTSSGDISQQFVLAATPVLPSTLRIIVDSAGGPQEWFYVDDLSTSAASDQIFTTDVDDQGVVTVEFGDGAHGAIPATGLAVAAAYRVGGGAYGNLPANSIVDLADAVLGVRVQASSTMTGGADAEPTDLIRTNAPRTFRARDRAVSRRDYADLALAIPGVANASAVSQSATSVALYIVGPNNNATSQVQRDAVAVYVRDRAIAGAQVLVFNGTLVPVNIGTVAAPVLIGVNARYRRIEVMLACKQALQNIFAPGSTDFAMRIPISTVYAVLAAVPGVDYAQVPMMARSDLAQTGTADVVCRAWEIPSIGVMTVNAVGGI